MTSPRFLFSKDGHLISSVNYCFAVSALSLSSSVVFSADGYRSPGLSAYESDLSLGNTLTHVRFDGSSWVSKMIVEKNGAGGFVEGLMPVKPDFVKIKAQGDNYKGLSSNGDLYSWGGNDYGKLGNGALDYAYEPSLTLAPIKIGSGFIDIGVTGYSSCAVREDGTFFHWGMTASKDSPSNPTPRPYSTLTWKITSIVSCGSAKAILLAQDGSLLSISIDGKGGNQVLPTVMGTGFTAASQGKNHLLAIKSDGSLWAWGWNGRGQIGDGSTTDRPEPVLVAHDVAAVAAGGNHSLCIKSDGSLFAWGDNSVGQLGNGSYRDSLVPEKVGDEFVSVEAGPFSSSAVKKDGSLWVWGWIDANLGETGAPPASSSWPRKIGENYRLLRSSAYHTLALKADGNLWSWGYNAGGALGRPVERWGDYYWLSAAPVEGERYVQVAAGGTNIPARDTITYSEFMPEGAYSLGIRLDGSLWGWGFNRYVMPYGTHIPARIGEEYQSVSAGYRHALALKRDGSLWAWGANDFGQLGDGSTQSRALPVNIGDGFKEAVAGMNYSLALSKDGGLWAWGRNDSGQLGDGTTTDRPSPVLIGHDYISLAAAKTSVIAIKNDGSLWAWGNRRGALRLLPGKKFRRVIAGYGSLFAIGDDGALWEWNSASIESAPAFIGYDFVDVALQGPNQMMDGSLSRFAQYFGVRSDGSLWAWGSNVIGQYGVCSCVNTPIQILLGRGKSFATLAYPANPPKDHTLTFDIRAKAEDQGRAVRLFAAVQLPERLGGGWLAYGEKGWSAWNGKVETLPSFQSVASLPEIQTTVLYRDANVIDLSGAKLYVGYGLDEGDVSSSARAMLRDGTFSNVHSLP